MILPKRKNYSKDASDLKSKSPIDFDLPLKPIKLFLKKSRPFLVKLRDGAIK
jgi:hypothetical protein